MTDWLKKRLPPAKARSPMWVELTESVQEFWDDNYEPLIDSVERARSVFTADAEDVEIRLAERGIKFEVALPFTSGSKAVSYAMRSYELHRKDDEAILTGILGRDFGGVAIRWMPLQAPKAEPYGSRFLTDIDLPWFDYNQSELWLTSRGKVLSDINTVLEMGFTRAEVKAAIERKISQLKPAHIVFDGVYFIAYFILVVEPCTLSQCAFSYSTTTLPINPFPSSFFDETRLDDYRLDIQPVHSSYKSASSATFSLDGLGGGLWHLDMGWIIDGVQRSVPGIEGDRVSLLSYLGADSKSVSTAIVPPVVADSTRFGITIFNPMQVDILPNYQFDILAADDYQLDRNTFSSRCVSQSISTAAIELNTKQWRLDMGWLIDGEFRAIPGIEGDTVSVFSSLGSSSSGFVASNVQPILLTSPGKPSAVVEYQPMELGIFRNWYFDDTPADDVRLDSDTASARSVSKSVAIAQMWPAHQWSLDIGTEINGYFRSVAGIENDQVPILSNLGCDSSSTAIFTVSPTFSKVGAVESAQIHAFEGLQLQPTAPLTKGVNVFSSFKSSSANIYADFPRLDDIPADFIPLDVGFS